MKDIFFCSFALLWSRYGAAGRWNTRHADTPRTRRRQQNPSAWPHAQRPKAWRQLGTCSPCQVLLGCLAVAEPADAISTGVSP